MKAIQDEISKDELRILNKWLESSLKNRTDFDRMKKLWSEMSSIPTNPPAIDIKKEWASFEKRRDKVADNIYGKSGLQQNLVDKLNYLLSIRKYLALRPVYLSFILIILTITSIYLYLNISVTEVNQRTFATSNKQKVKVQLSDGSSIQLNSGSSITVQDEFSENEREVKLSGEAYFKVAKEKRPCIIITDNAKIEVLGTSFNVWSRNNITRVIVKEGIVRLSSLKSNRDFVLLQADHMSQIIEDKRPLDARKVDADRYIGWPEGKLVFEHSPLFEFVDEIERQYNVNITIQSNEIKNLKLTGTFDNLNIEQILSSICLTFNLAYDNIDPDHFMIRQK